MKTKGLLFMLAGLLVGSLLGALILLSGPDPAESSRRLPPTIGSALQDFTLQTVDGKTQSLSSLRGKPVILNFWATWCAPCKEEMPLLDRYARTYADQLVVVGINYEEGADDVTSFLAETGTTFPIWLDSSGEVADLYFVRNFPTTFFLDSEGVLRAQHLGLLNDESMARYLKTVGLKP